MASPMRTPKGRSITRTMASTATAAGRTGSTDQATGRAMSSDTRSGALIARVFGITSAKTITRSDITIVA